MTPRRGTAALYLSALVATAALVGCGEDSDTPTPADPATAYVERGPHAVGHRVDDADGLTIKAWYPAAAEADGDIEYAFVLKFPGFPADPVAAHGRALADADAAPGRHPIVALSHGFGLNPEWYHQLAEHMASHGFVVVAPEHTEHDWAPDVVRASIARPADISAALDFALSGPLSAHVDPEHIAAVGHSYGGYTALALAGARFDMQGHAESCADVEDPFVQGYLCDPFTEDALTAEMGLDAAPEGLWPTLADDRIDAIVALAGDAHLFGARGLAEVTVPALLIGGTADTGSPWDWGTGLAFEHIGSADRTLVAFEGSEHFVGVSSCDDLPFMQGFPEEMRAYICDDPAWDKPAELALVDHLTTAFLAKTLRGEPEAAAALDPAVYAEVEGLSVTAGR